MSPENSATVNGRKNGTHVYPELHLVAIRAEGLGISVCPPVETGAKAPGPANPRKETRWHHLQSQRANLYTIGKWYGPRFGLGFVTGAVSGNLECLDFDDPETFERFVEAAAAMGLGELVGRIRAGYCSRTPSGGRHFLWRCETIGGNTKLAMRPDPHDPKKQKTLIETKAEGGYVIEPPSGGPVHPSGRDYEMEAGALETIETITPEERGLVLALAHSFDERVPEPPPDSKPKANRKDGSLRPGDDFNDRGSWDEVLTGWSKLYAVGRKVYWRRPGKEDRGGSATTGFGDGPDLLFVFSTSTDFEIGKWYTRFQAYAHLHHGKNYSAAAKALAARGYGEQRQTRVKVKGRCHTVGGGPSADGQHQGGGQGGEPEAEATPEDDRPEIEITVERHEVVEQAVEALAADRNLYTRGHALVSVAVEQHDSIRLAGGVKMANAKGTPRVIVLPESAIGCRLTEYATFYAWTKDKNGESIAKPCHPPSWLIKAIHERQCWPKVRPLVSIAAAPFIRADGSVVQSPGYDPQTGTLYQPSAGFPAIPDRPTRDDARRAADRLLALVAQFPFASNDDRAVWLAGVLDGPARPAIPGPVPGKAIIGNRAGCGKGLLIDIPSILNWGMNAPTFCYPTDKIEADKATLAIAIEATPIVHLDNLEEGSSYGSPALDSVLTSTTKAGRILGTSRTTGTLAVRTCWWLSGNNVSPAKDAYRRWLPCNLSSDLERPEERSDIRIPNLRAHVAERRGELVRDALVILKAHAEAGYPNGGWAPLGSFEEWDRIVRGAVWYATGWDCCVTRRKAADESPDRLDKIALLEGWRELPQGGADGNGVSAEDAIKAVTGAPGSYETLRAVFARKSRDGKPPTARQIGNLIRGMKGGRFGGLAFEKAGDHKRSILWRVAGTPEPSPDSTDRSGSGESDVFPDSPLHSHAREEVTPNSESGESDSDPRRGDADRGNIGDMHPATAVTAWDSDSPDSQTHRYDPIDPDDDHGR